MGEREERRLKPLLLLQDGRERWKEGLRAWFCEGDGHLQGLSLPMHRGEECFYSSLRVEELLEEHLSTVGKEIASFLLPPRSLGV